MQKMMKRLPGMSGTNKGRGGKKKGKKGGRVTAPPSVTNTGPKQPFTLPGLN
jgi:hypothetical protein